MKKVIEAIKNIGEYYLAEKGWQLDNPVEIFIEDPASSSAYKHVLLINTFATSVVEII